MIYTIFGQREVELPCIESLLAHWICFLVLFHLVKAVHVSLLNGTDLDRLLLADVLLRDRRSLLLVTTSGGETTA